VLDLDAFERCNKAEGLGVSDGTTQAKNLQDTDNTCKLFRFLQLLCEGHNLGETSTAHNTDLIHFISLLHCVQSLCCAIVSYMGVGGEFWIVLNKLEIGKSKYNTQVHVLSFSTVALAATAEYFS